MGFKLTWELGLREKNLTPKEYLHNNVDFWISSWPLVYVDKMWGKRQGLHVYNYERFPSPKKLGLRI